MEGMIEHHATAVHMANMCTAKAVHEELDALCEDIVEARTQEIATMQGAVLLVGRTCSPEMTRGHEQMTARMEAMSPERFEIEFMKMMIRHHRRAVAKATNGLQRA
jgi:hypothetical protein